MRRTQTSGIPDFNLDGSDAATPAPKKPAYNRRHSDTTAISIDPHREAQLFAMYRELGELQTYVWLNTTGFKKIMKKVDKVLGLRGTGNEVSPAFDNVLAMQAFKSAQLDSLMEHAQWRSKSANETSGGQHVMKLIGGSANPELAQEIAGRLGVPLSRCSVRLSEGGETRIQVRTISSSSL